MTDPLIARLTEVLVAAQRRYRTRCGWGALTSIPIPDGLIDEIAAGVAPVLRDLNRETAAVLLPNLIEEALAARFDLPATTPHGFTADPARVRLEPIDLRPGKEAS